MRSRFLLIPLCSLAGLTGCGGSSSPSPHAIAPTPAPVATPTHISPARFDAVLAGLVRNAQTKKPVPGARIIIGINQKKTVTGADGRYRVVFPSGAAVSVQVRAKGYEPGLAEGVVKPHHTAHVNFRLSPLSHGHPAPPSPPFIFGSP